MRATTLVIATQSTSLNCSYLILQHTLNVQAADPLHELGHAGLDKNGVSNGKDGVRVNVAQLGLDDRLAASGFNDLRLDHNELVHTYRTAVVDICLLYTSPSPRD